MSKVSRERYMAVILQIYGIVSIITTVVWVLNLSGYVQFALHWMMFCGGVWVLWQMNFSARANKIGEWDL